MSQTHKEKDRLDYSETLRILGHFIQQERLSDVSILEYDKGWIVHGLTYKSTAQGFIRITSDHLISHDDLLNLQERLKVQRKEPQVKRSRWGL